MTIRVRIGLVFATVSLVLAVPALYGASRLSRLRDIAVDQGERNAEASLARFQTALSELDRVQRSHLVSPDDRLRHSVIQALDEMDTQVSSLTRSGYARAAQLPRAKVDSLRVSTASVQTLIDMDRLPEAAREFGATLRLMASTQASLEPLASEIDRRRIEALASAREVSATAAHSTLIGLLAALALAVMIAGWAARALVDPLNRLAVGMANVAEGAFVVPADLPLNRQDEIGDLSRSFCAMTRRLAEFDTMRTEVLGNLVGNALKFTGPGGEVTVSASRTAGAVRFEVADTGIGIAPRDLPFIFEKYYQAGGRKRSAGSGLGLAIVRQAVAAHGGTVTVTSTPGSGTVFTVVLPLHEVPHAKDPAVPNGHSSPLQRAS